MDTCRATEDFGTVDRHGLLALRRGERLALLDAEGDDVARKGWTGVMRLADRKLGYVPCKLLKPEKKRARETRLPENFTAQYEEHQQLLRQIHQKHKHQIPDIYKLPPTELLALDDWKPDAPEDGSEKSFQSSEEELSKPEVARDEPFHGECIVIPKSSITQYYSNAAATYAPTEDPRRAHSPSFVELQRPSPAPSPRPSRARPYTIIGDLKRSDWDEIVADVDRQERHHSDPMDTEPEPDYDAREPEVDQPTEIKPKPVSGVKLFGEVNRELEFNKRRGIDPLQRKPELQRRFEQRGKSRSEGHQTSSSGDSGGGSVNPGYSKTLNDKLRKRATIIYEAEREKTAPPVETNELNRVFVRRNLNKN